MISNASGESAHAGTYFAWLDGYGSATTDTVTQSVAIPSTTTTATLSFWLHIDTAETTTTTVYDTLTVQLQNSSGGVLTTLATYSNLDKGTGYVQPSVLLEFGARSTGDPNESRSVLCDAAQHVHHRVDEEPDDVRRQQHLAQQRPERRAAA